jgi:endonuclease/exonuclease/phosphatase (EEP) superfamily protein YafD
MRTFISPQSLRFAFKKFFCVLLGAYILGLICYLLLRITWGETFWWLALLNDFVVGLIFPLPIVIVLSILFRFRWILVFGLSLVLVLSFWFVPYFLPKSIIPKGDPLFSVITFNVWGQNSRLEDVHSWLRLQDADIVLIQEIPETYATHGIPDLEDIYPFQVSQPTSERMWGNLLLSQHPILSEELLPGDGVPAQQRFTIDFYGNVVAIYNVHLAMPIGNSSRSPIAFENFILDTAFRYNHSARNSEIKRILKLVQNEPYPFVVAGDFNMSEQSMIYSEIANTMGDAFREAGSGWGGSWPNSVVNEIPAFMPPLLRVDYIWYSKHFLVLESFKGPQLGSDHLPFYAIFEFQNDIQHFPKT